MKSFFITVQWRWGRKRNSERSSRAKPNRKVLMRMSPRGNDSVVWEEVMPAEREAAQGCCLGGLGLSFGFLGYSISFQSSSLGMWGRGAVRGSDGVVAVTPELRNTWVLPMGN